MKNIWIAIFKKLELVVEKVIFRKKKKGQRTVSQFAMILDCSIMLIS